MVLIGLAGGNVAAQKNDIDLNFQSVQLKDAFRALADVANMNVVTDSSVEGTTTVHLENISFREAVDLLAKSSGLDYRIVNNTILVASHDKLQKGFGKKVTRVFKLKNSEPKDLKQSINLLIDDASIRVDKRTSSLIITTYQSKLPEVESTIKQLDEEKKQIIIQARIEEVTKSGLSEIGINWDFNELNFQADDEDSSDDSDSSDSSDGDSGSNLLEIGDVSLKYKSLLNMLEKNGDANLLANPRLTTVDGKKANIEIGESVPIIKPGGDQQTEVTFKDIGVSLEINPHITESNKVFISVKPEVSVVSEYFETADGARYPIIETRNAETNVRVTSGETIAIGGLIKEEEYKNMRKVPFLGDIPGLGKLFKNESTDTQKTELIIFLTPKIVDSTEKMASSQINETVKTFKYVVQKQDNIWNISNLFDVSFADMLEYNNIEYVSDIKAGKTLKVPANPNNYYTIKADDTLSKLAKRFEIEISTIKKINNVDSIKNMQGEEIYLPNKSN